MRTAFKTPGHKMRFSLPVSPKQLLSADHFAWNNEPVTTNGSACESAPYGICIIPNPLSTWLRTAHGTADGGAQDSAEVRDLRRCPL
jgi:hypothetical protein